MDQSAVVIAPHPDDAEIGMGGTIAALSASGVDVLLIDLTNGEPTPYGSLEIRAQETKEASRILGVSERVCLNIPNREVFDSVENRKKVASVLREYKPQVMFIPYWEDGHPDHIHASQLCESAAFYSKFVKTDMPFEPHKPRKIFYYFATHIRVKVQPSFVFDVSRFIDAKLGAVRAYQSQFSVNPINVGVIDLLRQETAYWGTQIGVAYGEPFTCREQIRLSDCKALLNA